MYLLNIEFNTQSLNIGANRSFVTKIYGKVVGIDRDGQLSLRFEEMPILGETLELESIDKIDIRLME